ncbi:YihY/virulence factor BrkB family protein [Tropicimonas marinistellae]|uniref:YihY/virulence factor BrkB family protein n=1 Tax=Tropicimonas marinistellae TaxID=1739787 RepID=UPI00082AB7AD|nr:YihY/virulence factor BrkB family protein [Tropicimonas marinistellae]
MTHYILALRNAWLRFDTEFGWSRSSHVALSMMLALFPFCIFSLSLAGMLSADLEIEALTEFVFGSWPDTIAGPVVREMEAVLGDSNLRTLTFGGLLATYFASNGVDAVRLAITSAYREEDPRPVWRTRSLCLIFVLGGSVIICVAGALSVAVPIYLQLVSGPNSSFLPGFVTNESLRTALSTGVLLFAVYAAHAWLPGIHRPARRLLPGILLTVLLWSIAGAAFGVYFRHFATYSVTYAGLSGIMGALVFLYLMSAIFIFGAEFNGQLMRQNSGDRSVDVPK